MNVALCLLVYGGVVALFGPSVLQRLTHSGAAPRLGVAAWLVAVVGALGSWLLAAGMLLVEFATYWHADVAVRVCVDALSTPVNEAASPTLRAVSFAVAAVVITGAGVVLWRSVLILLRMRRRTLEHARAVLLVGRSRPDLGAVVLDSPQPQAYCVAGRPDAIVVTTAALDALAPDQLTAVLAHERAHLRGRHAALTAFVRGLATILPRVRLLTVGAEEIDRLLEMCADDEAARRHGAEPLLGGLIALVGAGTATPAHVMNAAGTAVVARAERLVSPASAVRRATNRTALLGVITATMMGMLEVAAGLLICSWIFG
ncbi:M56 family metallopeptidase [Nocardia sp. NPDC057440]|uniref:M56 family metallopeptidase n=1 Tax=Nocardia sp. NPDC057440 TaxID=3346134 RepID=UPI0036711F4F